MLPILSLREKIFYDMINRDEREGRKNIYSCHIEVYILTLQKHILLINAGYLLVMAVN